MRLRRYMMGSSRAKRLNRLLRNEKISVRKVAVVAHDTREDIVYVFFDYKEEDEQKDKETLERLKAKVIDVQKDTVYQKLSNVKQRELYLLDHYGLSKRDGGDVIELVKINETKTKEEEVKGTNETV